MEAATNHANVNIGSLEIRPPSSWPCSTAPPLTVRELELLTALAERHDRIVSREELYRVVWGEPYRSPTARWTSTSASCATSWSRRNGSRLIHTHFGFGYRLSSA